MTGTALYRALVAAGSPEELAKEAVDAGDQKIIAIDDKFDDICEQLKKLQLGQAELRSEVKIILRLLLGVFIAVIGIAAKVIFL